MRPEDVAPILLRADETVAVRNGYGEIVSMLVGGSPVEPACRACGCARDDHSRVLLAAPCLECAPCSFYVGSVARPNPTIIRGESEVINERRPRRRRGTASSGPR